MEVGMSGVYHCQVDPVKANAFSGCCGDGQHTGVYQQERGSCPSLNLALSDSPNNCISQSSILAFLEKLSATTAVSTATLAIKHKSWIRLVLGEGILTGWASERGVHDYGDTRDYCWVPGPSLYQQMP